MARLPRAAEYAATYGTSAYILTLPLEFTSVWLHQQLSRFVLVFVGLAVGYLVISRRRLLKVPSSPSVWLLVIYVVASLASWLLSRAPGSLTSVADLTLYPLVALLLVNLVVTESDQRRAWFAFLISGLGVAVLGVLLYVAHLSLWTPNHLVATRLNITFGDPNITARFLTLGACAAILMFAARQGPSWLSIGSALACAAVLPLTLSRSGLVLFVATVLLAVVVAFNHRRAAAIGAVALLVCTFSAATNAETRERAEGAVAIAVSLVTERPASVGPPTSQRSQQASVVDDNRRYLVGAGLKMFTDHTAIGVGYGGYQHALLTTYRYFLPGNRTGPNLDSLSHTTFVTVLAEQGVAGALLFTVFFVLLGVEAWRARQRRGDFAVWSIIPATLIIPIFAYSQIEGRLFSEPYFWMSLGLMYSANRSAVPQAARGSAPRPKYAASSSLR